jgi:cell division protein FtsZ
MPEAAVGLRNGTDGLTMANGAEITAPTVMRGRGAHAQAQVRALETSGMEHYDIPAFLRRQAD